MRPSLFPYLVVICICFSLFVNATELIAIVHETNTVAPLVNSKKLTSLFTLLEDDRFTDLILSNKSINWHSKHTSTVHTFENAIDAFDHRKTLSLLALCSEELTNLFKNEFDPNLISAAFYLQNFPNDAIENFSSKSKKKWKKLERLGVSSLIAKGSLDEFNNKLELLPPSLRAQTHQLQKIIDTGGPLKKYMALQILVQVRDFVTEIANPDDGFPDLSPTIELLNKPESIANYKKLTKHLEAIRDTNNLAIELKSKNEEFRYISSLLSRTSPSSKDFTKDPNSLDILLNPSTNGLYSRAAKLYRSKDGYACVVLKKNSFNLEPSLCPISNLLQDIYDPNVQDYTKYLHQHWYTMYDMVLHEFGDKRYKD